MRTRGLLLLTILSALLLTGGVVRLSAVAQDETWSAWLYNPTTLSMHRVQAGGEVESFSLPVPGGYRLDEYDRVAVAPDGMTMAYTVRDAANTPALTLYSHITGTIIATYAPGTLLASSLELNTRFQFSPDSTAFAYGYSFEDGVWELVVIDLATLSLRAALRSTDPVASGIAVGFGLTPVVQHFRSDGSVAFALVPYATDAYLFESFIWQYEAGNITRVIGYPTLNMDILAYAGEALATLPDTRLPMRDDLFPFAHFNTVQVYQIAAGERFPVIATDALSLGAARFVANGTRIALTGFDADGIVSVLLYTRSGVWLNTLREVPDVYYSLAGTIDGLLMLRDSATGSALIEVNLDTGTLGDGVTVWTVPDRRVQIAWVGIYGSTLFFIPVMTESWAQLAPPLSDTGAVSSTTGGATGGVLGTPPAEPETLRVGGVAIVRTTGGDQLNLRTAAGTQFAIAEKLPAGTRVELLEGPVSTGGFIWWRVRVPSGREGWLVEYADNEVTLLPAGGGTAAGVVDEAGQGVGNAGMTSLLRVGQDAVVTLSNRRDSLRLRNAAGLNGRVIVLLPNGTRVRVLDGPRNVDNFVWWQVRTPEGNVGWVAEIIGGERALSPLP